MDLETLQKIQNLQKIKNTLKNSTPSFEKILYITKDFPNASVKDIVEKDIRVLSNILKEFNLDSNLVDIVSCLYDPKPINEEKCPHSYFLLKEDVSACIPEKVETKLNIEKPTEIHRIRSNQYLGDIILLIDQWKTKFNKGKGSVSESANKAIKDAIRFLVKDDLEYINNILDNGITVEEFKTKFPSREQEGKTFLQRDIPKFDNVEKPKFKSEIIKFMRKLFSETDDQFKSFKSIIFPIFGITKGGMRKTRRATTRS